MIKLLFITDTNIGGRAGAEQHLKTIVSCLDYSKFSARVLQLAPTVPQEEGKVAQCFYSHMPTEGVLSLRGAESIYKVIQLVRSNNYDCLISYFENSDIISVIASIFTARKTLISSRRDTGFRHSRKLKWLYKLINKRFHLIIVASDAICKGLIEDGVDPSRIRTIYNGVDTSRFRNADGKKLRRELMLADDAMLLGMAANFTPVKNHKLVISCLNRFHQNGKTLHLVLAGDGPLRDDLIDYSRTLNLGGFVHFIGRRKDIPDVLSGIDIFVLSSRTEGLSNALLEAMAGGKPAVATNVGGNPEVVVDGKTGYLVPNDNADELYIAIEKLVESRSLREEFGAAARQRVTEKFSMETMVAQYVDAIEAAVASSGCKNHER